MSFFKTAMARGLIYQVIGHVAGMAFIFVVRLIMGLPVFEGGGLVTGAAEGSWAFGGVVGVLAFMKGTGVLDDWIKWAKGQSTPDHHEDKPGWQKYFNVSMDH